MSGRLDQQLPAPKFRVITRKLIHQAQLFLRVATG